jgi:predicted extracellular nuclease
MREETVMHALPLRVRLIFASATAILGILLAAPAKAQPTELFFSEYIEGSSNNKALEIYNGTGSAIDLLTGGYNIQMFFNGSASAGLTINLTGTVAAGDVYVVAQSSADPVILAQADQTNGAGWFNGDDAVVLRKGTTVIDLIGQVGSDPGTEWGTGLTSTADNTLRRKAATCGGDTNPTDVFDPSVEWDGFATNTFDNLGVFASTCGLTGPTGVGAANPSSVQPGGLTLLTVTVTPGSNPTSTGLAVTGNLTSIGGSATQQFYDDGVTGGDVTANDNVFSYQATVAPATTTGNKTLPISITDAQARSGSASISLAVALSLAIHDIQGSGSTSPFAGAVVETTGLVTGVKSNGFFIQTKPGFEDADPSTSEGVFVFTSSAPPPGAAVGSEVKVTGTVQEFIPGADLNSPPMTEIAGAPSVTLLSSGNPLPAPITLTAADTDPAGSIEQLEKYEGMRVHVDSLTIVGPTQGSISEANATSTSIGVFYGVITGIARPFREPGIEVPDPLPAGSPCCVPSFDANPERLRVDSDGQVGAAALEVTAGAVATNLTGPLDYAFRTYTILPDPASVPGVSGNLPGAIPVPVPAADQFTVGSFNMERFFDTTDDSNTQDAVLTPTAFNNRLNKASLAIRNVLRMPDILGVEEMENLSTLQAVAARINSDAVAASQPNPNYVAYLVEGNDIGGIDVGLLVKSSRVNVIDVTQYGKDTTYIDPNTGLPELLNDRPPLLLRATVNAPTGAPFPVTVIVNHLRSLSGVDDPADGNRVRTKRRAQAEFLANLIQVRQAADPNEHIISIGDYNAFQFNDGYVDSISTIRGTPTLCDQVVLCSSDLVNPDLADLVDTAPASERYSFVFDGNAQVLDHELVTQNLLQRFEGLHYARNDADFPESFRNDPSRPERISDHDPAVAYFRLPLLSALSPANVWVGLKDRAGLKNSNGVSIRFDLRAEIYYNGSTLVGSGELASAAGGGSGFHNTKLDSIPLDLPAAVGIAPGDTLSIKLLVRNACSGSGEDSGTARLWFNDTEADSHFDATIDDQEEDDYLLDGAALGSSPGPGPKKAADVSAGARCSAFKPFGTWTRTLN